MSRTFMIAAVIVAVAGAGLVAILLLINHTNDGPILRTTEAITATAAAPVSAAYTVSMSPMGDVRFPHVPQRIVTLDANYNDMLVALGEEGHLAASGYRNNFYDGFYRELAGATIGLDPEHLTYLSHAGGGMFDKELLYSLNPDVFHIDPLQLASSRGWSQADVDEIAHNVAPFFANRYSRENNYSGKQPYTYYSLFELSAKVGEVYHRADRITRLHAIYVTLVSDIAGKLPPLAQRPRIGLIFYYNGKITPYSLLHGGFGQAQYRDVGARDAFDSMSSSTFGAKGGDGGPSLDIEGLLAVDPDVLIMPFAIYPASQSATSRASFERLLTLKDDPLAQRLTAFHNGAVFPGGTPLQGPLFYLFQIEMAAKQIYPKLFGPYRDDQAYPAAERLFDRAAVAAIVEGKTVGP